MIQRCNDYQLGRAYKFIKGVLFLLVLALRQGVEPSTTNSTDAVTTAAPVSTTQIINTTTTTTAGTSTTTSAEVRSALQSSNPSFSTYTSAWSNKSVLLLSSRTCQTDADCDEYEFCFGKVGFGNAGQGLCQNFFTELCTTNFPCDVGDGDCDSDYDCVSDLVCGTDNCPFIGTNRIPSSADCCTQPPAPEWVFGETETVATLSLDSVATALESSIANGTFTTLLQSMGFDYFNILTTFFIENVVYDRIYIESVLQMTGSLGPDDFSILIEPHKDYQYFFKVGIASVLGLESYAQISITDIVNDTSSILNSGDSEFQQYRRLSSTETLKISFLIDLGTIGTYFTKSFAITPRSARSSVSYNTYLQSATRTTGKKCGAGYMGHDCTERICAYGISIYSSMFTDLDELYTPGFSHLNGPTYSGAQHSYSECSDAGICNRNTGLCDCFSPYSGKACTRHNCPEKCSSHGKCVPSSLVDGTRPSDTDAIALSTSNWDNYKYHFCACDAGWEGKSCSRKICPRGDYVMTVLSNHEDEFSGCDVQQLTFSNMSMGDTFVLTFKNFEHDRKKTSPIFFSGNATSTAAAIEIALLQLPNDVIPSVVAMPSNMSSFDSVAVDVIFIDPRNSGLQELLICETIPEDQICLGGMQPMMLGNTGTCSIEHMLKEQELNEDAECGGRGHCDRKLGICECNIGTYGEACELITDYI
jgi:hypothetical protein